MNTYSLVDNINFKLLKQKYFIMKGGIYEIIMKTINNYLFTKDISDLSNGVYIINVKGNKGSVLTKKFIKQ